MAQQLGVRGIFAEKEGTGRAFRRGFSIKAGERVLIVDNILTTGSSIREGMTAVTEQGGVIVSIGVLVDRPEKAVYFGVPLFSCHRALTTTYSPENCPRYARQIPLVKPGGS